MHWTTLDKGRTYDNDVMKCCFSVDQIEVIGASTSMAPLVSTWAKKTDARHGWQLLSHFSWPAHTWRGPEAFIMSCRSSPRIVFDIILLETSPMLIGRTNLNVELLKLSIIFCLMA